MTDDSIMPPRELWARPHWPRGTVGQIAMNHETKINSVRYVIASSVEADKAKRARLADALEQAFEDPAGEDILMNRIDDVLAYLRAQP